MDIIEPGAFEKQVGLKVPVTFRGRAVGRAEISRDGQIINAELDAGSLPLEMRDAFITGYAEALSIDVHTTPAHPASLPPYLKENKNHGR